MWESENEIKYCQRALERERGGEKIENCLAKTKGDVILKREGSLLMIVKKKIEREK